MEAVLRVLLDANLFISYLLNPIAASPPVRMVESALGDRYRLLLPGAVVDEVQRRRASKPYLNQRIDPGLVDQLVDTLRLVAELVPPAPEPYPMVARDRNDDYLIAHAIAARADFLVSGDKDLLVLGRVEGVRIVSPAEFLSILGAMNEAR